MKIVTFGEIMLRLTPPGKDRLVAADSFEACYGGAEANVALSLAILGTESSFVTKLPENPLGEAARNHLRRYGVDTEHILFGGNRLGVYYLEEGMDKRPSRVVYDRKNSSFAEIQPNEFDFDTILAGADYFHLSGITPALSDTCFAACLSALKAAQKQGVRVSFDPNYRAALWSVEEASKAMEAILPYVDILITNENQAAELFALPIDPSEITGDTVSDKGYATLAKALYDRYSLKAVALTERRTFSVNVNSIAAKLYDGECFVSSPTYKMDILDRVGGGDAFAAGLLYALASDMPLQSAVDFAAAACCLKHSIKGDANLATKDEILSLANGNMNGRTKR